MIRLFKGNLCHWLWRSVNSFIYYVNPASTPKSQIIIHKCVYLYSILIDSLHLLWFFCLLLHLNASFSILFFLSSGLWVYAQVMTPHGKHWLLLYTMLSGTYKYNKHLLTVASTWQIFYPPKLVIYMSDGRLVGINFNIHSFTLFHTI